MRTKTKKLSNLARRLLSVLLAVVLVTGLLPMRASAKRVWDVLIESKYLSDIVNAGYDIHGYQNYAGTSYWGAAVGNCTNYCAYMFYSQGIRNVWFSHGATWANHARDLGYTVNQTPVAGCVAQWNAWATGMTQYGHVAYVEEVYNDYILISEDNGFDAKGNPGGPFRFRRVWRGTDDWPSNFIHFKPTHTHSYGNNGYCTCGSYGGENSENTGVAGNYELTKKANSYTKPYAGASVASSAWKQGDVVSVKSTVKNVHGETWYKLQNNTYMQSLVLKREPEHKFFFELNRYPTGTILEATKSPVSGNVSAKNYDLKQVAVVCREKAGGKTIFQASVAPKARNYGIGGVNDPIARALHIEDLNPGQYELVFSLTDSRDKSESRTYPFTVLEDKNMLDKPVISTPINIDTGKRVEINPPEPGAEIYYTLDGTTPVKGQAGTRKYLGGLNLETNTTIKAYAVKSGKKDSRVSTSVVPVVQLDVPSFSVSKTPENATVILKGPDGARLYYSTNGGSYKIYSGPVVIDKTTSLQAYARKIGYGQSETSITEVELMAPDAPVPEKPAEARVAQESNFGLSWQTAPEAGSYQVEVSLDGTVIETVEGLEGGNYSCTLEQAGVYQFRVRGINHFGEGEWSEPVQVESMKPVTVTFTADGSPVSVQTVPYGGDAVRPEAPERRGYTFQGWSASYRNVTKDLTVEAEYSVNQYTIEFKDQRGLEISALRRTGVPFGTALELPEGPASIDKDYAFVDWYLEEGELDTTDEGDTRLVASDLTFVAVYELKDPDNVAVLSNPFVKQADNPNNMFTASVQVENRSGEVMNARLVVSLKSSDDKMLATAYEDVVIAASDMGPENQGTQAQLTMNYNGRYGTAVSADIAIVAMEEDGRTGGSLGTPLTNVSVTSSQFWSAWSEEQPGSGTYETMQEYRYRTKETKTTSSPLTSLGDWKLDKKTQSGYGPWQNSSTPVTASDTIDVGTPKHHDATGKTVYYYKRWLYTGSNGRTWNSYTEYWGSNYAGNGRWEYKVLDYPLTNVFETVDGRPHYSGDTHGWWAGGASNTGAYTSNTGWQVTSNAYTTYPYRTINYTYQYSRTGAWSDWSAVEPESAANLETEERTLYRYNISDSLSNTDTAGLKVTVSGTLPQGTADLAGKNAVVMVYHGRNTDPLQSQLEYVGRAVFGADNTYSFAVNTLRELSEDTGDFVVTLAIPGATSPIEVKRFAAPVPTHSVTFLNAAGEQIGEVQQVEEYRAAVAPEAPELPGYTFTGWDQSFADVVEDMTISPVYARKEYTVTYVDWQNHTMTERKFQYQDLFAGPLNDEKEELRPEFAGMIFSGWSTDGTAEHILKNANEITDNQVVYAVWEAQEFTVTFVHTTGETTQTLSTQKVAYGAAATPPATDPSVAGMIFLGWSTDMAWWNVTEDCVVSALFAYEETSAEPTSNLSSGSYAGQQTLELSAPADGNTQLYYMVEPFANTAEETVSTFDAGQEEEPIAGSLHMQTGDNGFKLYDGPITLTQSAIVRTYTVADGKNNSQVVDLYLMIQEPAADEEMANAVDLAKTLVTVKPGDTVDLTVNLKENPGLMGLQFYVEADSDVFYMDYNVENEQFDYVTGNVASSGTTLVNTLESGGWQVFWWSPTAVTENGSLITLKLKVAEGVKAGDYPITLRYLPRNTVTTGSLAVDPGRAELAVHSDNTVQRGDVNGDGQRTLADVIKIVRHISELETLTGEALSVADINGDGAITSADVVRLARFLIGLESVLYEDTAQ